MRIYTCYVKHATGTYKSNQLFIRCLLLSRLAPMINYQAFESGDLLLENIRQQGMVSLLELVKPLWVPYLLNCIN